MINNSNYEIWMIDYFDGKLNAEQEQLLFNFIATHAFAKEEFNLLQKSFTVEPIETPKQDFSFLKKPEFNQQKEQLTNLLIDELEGNLKDVNALKKAISAYPELNAERTLLQKTILTPDNAVVFPNKNKLKKAIPLLHLSFIKYAAAAVLFISFLLFYKPLPNNTPLANHQTNLPEKKIAESNSTLIKEKVKVKDNNFIKSNAPNKSKIAKSISSSIKPQISNQLASNLVRVEPKSGILPVNRNFHATNQSVAKIFEPKFIGNGLLNEGEDFLTVNELLKKKINEIPLVQNLPKDTSGNIKLAGLVQTIYNKNGLLTYQPITSDNGSKSGFAIISRFFSIERIHHQ